MDESEEEEEITVDKAIEHIGFGWFHVLVILCCGAISSIDAFEVVLVSILGPTLQCDWQLSSTQVALFSSCMFSGMLVGAPIWGFLSDKYGRVAMLRLSAVIALYYGMLSSISTNYAWMLLLHAVIGFSDAANYTLPFSLVSEFMPVRHRGPSVLVINLLWAVGACLEIGIVALFLPTLGWRYTVAFSSLPILLFLPLLLWLPCSPRLAMGQIDEAYAILKKMARMNGTEMPSGRLVASAVVEERGDVRQMFRGWKYTLSTILLTFIWFSGGFIYNGVVLLSAEIHRVPHKCLQNPSLTSNVTFNENSDDDCCRPMGPSNFLTILISTLGEPVGVILAIFSLNYIGRKPSLAAAQFFTAGIFVLLDFCMPLELTNVVLFALRSSASLMMAIPSAYTCELYPTSIRSTAVGVLFIPLRVASTTTSYIAQMLLLYNYLAALVVYASVALFSGICSLCLPIETKDRPTPDTLQDTLDSDADADLDMILPLALPQKSTRYETFSAKKAS